jgi:carbon storage regulator
MLVLSRKVGQRLLIDGQIVITVVQVGGQQARLGIEAPSEVQVLREELASFKTLSFRPNWGNREICAR